MPKKYLVTPALPYANGAPHLGHLLENIQANIFVRALRMSGKDVLYVCGADAHGTPIEINAKKAGIEPEKFTEIHRKNFDDAFKTFGIEFDGGFGTTHTDLNKKHAELIFNKLKANNHISTKSVEQLYDPEAKRFLADRMVKGTCPKCKAEDQYGDNCEVCGATYSPKDLINARSTLTDSKLILKSSKHYFFELSHYTEKLKAWTKQENNLSPEVQKFLKHWFAEGLQNWDISRDGPYFGFKIPGEDDKYFYVWLDAPIGYVALSDKAAQEKGQKFEDYWLDSNTEITHFIGKDIVYFHTLFWPAMLMGADYTLPKKVVVHGMLTVNGQKMSKSRGTFINADVFAENLNPETLRYYLACKLSSKIEDIDLNFEDFTGRVNADLVNKIINLISRTVPMLHKYNNGQAEKINLDSDLVRQIQDLAKNIELNYELCETGKVCKSVVDMADLGNKFLQDNKPWDVAKTDRKQAAAMLSLALWIGKVCVGYLKPIIPEIVQKTERILNLESFNFDNILDNFKPSAQLLKYERLFERIDPKKVDKMIEESKESKKEIKQEENNYIDIKDFMKVDLRAAKVLEASETEGSDKLISLKLDVGDLGIKHVFSGLRPHVEPADLLGRMVVLVHNLKPRKMRFGLSEGMVLAAADKNGKPVPVSAEGANPGDQIC